MNKKEYKELEKKFVSEMESRKVDYTFIGGFKGLFKFYYYLIFEKYRIIYFMKRVCDGMSHEFAWKTTQSYSKSEMEFILKSVS